MPVPSHDLWSFLCVQWVHLRWMVIVRCVDIGGIVDHDCLKFSFHNSDTNLSIVKICISWIFRIIKLQKSIDLLRKNKIDKLFETSKNTIIIWNKIVNIKFIANVEFLEFLSSGTLNIDILEIQIILKCLAAISQRV